MQWRRLCSLSRGERDGVQGLEVHRRVAAYFDEAALQLILAREQHEVDVGCEDDVLFEVAQPERRPEPFEAGEAH